MKNKTIDVYWTLHPMLQIPTSIFRDPIKEDVLAPCPVVADYNKRIRLITSPYNVEISPQWRYNQEKDQYEFLYFDADSSDLRDEYLWGLETLNVTGQELWYHPDKAQFQYILPYIFLSEEPVTMYLQGLQHSETRSQLDEVRFIEAVLKIDEYPRPLSSAYAFQKMKDTKAVFVKNQPHMKLIFSERVRLHKFTPTSKLEHWLKSNNNVTSYQKGTKSLFDLISKRKPKHLFKDIKNNIEYSEA
tara:strand:- start:3239 stop:3973 length:735 start_codon:yes stop_codon:yes gene_type:complete